MQKRVITHGLKYIELVQGQHADGHVCTQQATQHDATLYSGDILVRTFTLEVLP